ncbi:hypothetical protein BBAD15_g2744 [Beauveria bassiana D1-5]|uniref:Uncharacterized protein n=1 Tax=Beauveria bassiana D1-5 TaxID=1245745 RepID=A0A0A2WEC7_BEABA|nr:hypothetical protein BBAD15_g2744 [Beauveria bassiana D1-5]
MLFLPSSPWWGKQIARLGSKPVVLWALGGYGASFMLLGLGSLLLATDAVAGYVGLGILIVARIIYGLTVSAMVPACQVWALQRAGEGKRMAALATISSGLSSGRLFGPLCAAGMLAIHPLAPLGLLMVAPLLALVMLLRLPGTPPQPATERKSARLRPDCLPYLPVCLAAFGLCCLAAEPGRGGFALRAVWRSQATAPDADGTVVKRRVADDRRPGHDDFRAAVAVLRRLCATVVRGRAGDPGLSAAAERQACRWCRGRLGGDQPHARLRALRHAGAAGV